MQRRIFHRSSACICAKLSRAPLAAKIFGRNQVLAAAFSSDSQTPKRRGFIVGCKLDQKEMSIGCELLQKRTGRDVKQIISDAAYPLKAGEVLVQPGGLGRDKDGFVNDLCVIGLSDSGQVEPIACGSEQPLGWEVTEDHRNSIRKAVRLLKELGCRQLLVDSFGNNCVTAEAAIGATYSYKTHRGQRAEPKDEQEPVQVTRIDSEKPCADWDLGVALGGAELLARDLMERPANLCTPIHFCQQATESLSSQPGVEFEVRDESWLREQGMGGLLAVSRGSREPPRLLVARYRGRDSKASTGGEANNYDAWLVGKGVTFDSGGISIKPANKMADMRADMGGAAVTLSVFLAACQLRLPLNLGLCTPLCENLPDGSAVKPGDVIEMMSGLTVRVDNTDAEGRLLLADALHYCSQMRPKAVIDVATLTGAVAVALGSSRAGLFANRSAKQIESSLIDCGLRRGDLLHSMPVDRVYRGATRDASKIADLSNIGSPDRLAGACTAAAFLSHFVPTSIPWMHIDMAGVMQQGDSMTGRPARALLQFIVDMAQR